MSKLQENTLPVAGWLPVGGWGCDFFVKKTPHKSISIALALRACVRACVRAKLRERDVSSVARVGQTDLWGGPSTLPWWGVRENSKFQKSTF